MTVLVIASVVVVAAGAAWLWWRRRERDRRLLEAHSIGPEALHAILASDKKPRVFDVRQPLDLLANSEILPGAERVAPKEIVENPALIPQNEDAVIYCTCPGDKTSRMILGKALGMNFVHVKILKGGLAAWKAKGYPVERYTASFHLDTPV